MKKLVDFQTLTLRLASPEEVKSWSHGEVTKPETINYRTLKPEKDGLFCERIFGPTHDYECYCGKYKRVRYRGIICDKCGVEVTQSRVRRERMGHIKLACPVAHVWFFKGAPSKLSLILNIPPRNLSRVIYFASYLVNSVDEKERKKIQKRLDKDLEKKLKELEKENHKEELGVKKETKKQLREIEKKIKDKEQRELALEEAKLKAKQEITSLKENLSIEKERAEEVFKTLKTMVRSIKKAGVISEDEYLKLRDYEAASFLEVGMGAEAILKLIERTDFEKLTSRLKKISYSSKGQRRIKATKRLRVIEGMRNAVIEVSWMILQVLPVIPPDLRPMVQLSGGRFASSDLNDLYRRVINRNNRLKHLINLGAPEIILRNEKRMLQEAVDTLIDVSQNRPRLRRRRGSKELRSLSEMLRGKQGRFRQNLLGKRVDYSGRSVIVVGPELKLNQCGLPKEMALEMFRPYVLRELITQGLAPNVKNAKNMLERKPAEVFDILEKITKNHPVLLNRAPTLHKLGIQAFYPVLVEGQAIRIHPCVCAGYNADFDGDQMAVHLPLSSQAIKEAEELMMAEHNLLKPANGSPITLPNKEMALGCFYLTSINEEDKMQDETIFSSPHEAILAFQEKKIKLRQLIKVRLNGKIEEITIGRLFFNQVLPKEMGFINKTVNAGRIRQLIEQSLEKLSTEKTMWLIDDLKDLGFVAATLSGLSVSLSDCTVILEKDKIIQEANKKASNIEKDFKAGLITEEEKRRLTNEVWMETTDVLAEKTWASFEKDNAVKLIIESGGTRASKDQVKQLAAMRGLVVDPLGKIVELPTKSNFREGLSVFEYVTSSRGSRKGLTDSALKTADAGYLTRRLVDVAHDAIIREEDCGTEEGIEVSKEGIRAGTFKMRVLGRVLAVNLKKGRKILLRKGEVVDKEAYVKIQKAGVKEVKVRSPLTCESLYGVCSRCYGWDFSNKKIAPIGTPVGVLAAQSIGEPGTQLTMRVRHFGGIVISDVTQGLPRVEELFEARTPKVLSPISEIAGKVKVEETAQGYQITVTSTHAKPSEEKQYQVSLTNRLRVKTGDLIPQGFQLASGGLDIKEILRVKGLKAAQEYLIREVQKVYESQGIPINDKHFEVIVRKMSDKVCVESIGDTSLLSGEMVERHRFEEENARVLAEGGEPATAKIVILGITKAALYTDSWLSAASFQETSNVLTDASVQGKEDRLLGLKENVIIGRLIPTDSERAKMENGL